MSKIGAGRFNGGDVVFKIPWSLSALVRDGLWPADAAQARAQNSRSLVAAERIRRFAPEEHVIYLQAPPFHTLAEEVGDPITAFWSEFGALHQIDPSRALVMGDFGPGSDAPIILQYGPDDAEPSVLRLQWSEGAPREIVTNWVLVARTFDEFAEMLGFGAR